MQTKPEKNEPKKRKNLRKPENQKTKKNKNANNVKDVENCQKRQNT